MTPTRVAVVADHNGVALKRRLKMVLEARGCDVDDRGVHGDEVVDYPPLCIDLCRQVVDGPAEFGVVVGGSGMGEVIACNKIRGVRAGLCHSLFTAEISRGNNDANVMVVGAKVVSPDLAEEILLRWLDTSFRGGPHRQRVEQIVALEQTGSGRLQGRAVIVTGGGHGFGRVCAERLAAEGARLVVADVDGTAAADVAAGVRSAGGEATAVPTGIADPARVEALAAHTLARFGRIDVLVDCTVAPSPSQGGLDELSAHGADEMAEGVRGAWLTARAVAPTMRSQGYGKIITVGSGRSAEELLRAAGDAARAGLAPAARGRSASVIRVNCVALAGTSEAEGPGDLSPHVATAVAFLAAPDADLVTGQTLVVDGALARP